MNFRTYDILTQLIPGLFFTVIAVTISKPDINWDEIAGGMFALLTVICFIIGYMINAFGHFLESLIVNTKINEAVKEMNRNKKTKGFLGWFKKFTKLAHIENQLYTSVHSSFGNDYDNLNIQNHEKLNWLNQEKKFARSIISTSFLIGVFIPILLYNKTVDNSALYISIMTLTLLMVGVYRYIVSSIDYASLVIKLSAKNDSEKQEVQHSD
jgi:hypothetical protein